MSETDGLVHPVLEGCELRLVAARAADTDRLATSTAMARIPDDACAACAVEKVEQCRRATHDVLIAMTGAARLSAVVWIEKSGQEAIDLLDALGGPDEGTSLGSYAPPGGQMADPAAMVEVLRVSPRSTVVIATAIIDSRAVSAAMS